MFRPALAAALLPLTVLAVLACETTVVDGDAPDAMLDDEMAAALVVPTDVETTRLYISATNTVWVDDEKPWSYGLFELNAKSQVRIALLGEADHGVGMKVYRVRDDGSLALLGTFDGPSGTVAVRLRSNFGGSYVVQSVSDPTPAQINIDIACTQTNSPDGRCTPQRQPGEMCGGFAGFACDDGLACVMEAGMCQVADGAGTCSVQPTMCPLFYAPVCGCDSHTYGNGCAAAAAGVSVDHTGACECDPAMFDGHDGATEDEVEATWVFRGAVSGWVVTSTLILDGGQYLWEEQRDPACLAFGCRMASQILWAEGTWALGTGTVVLAPTAESAPMLPTSLSVLVNCDDELRLQAWVDDAEELFTRE